MLLFTLQSVFVFNGILMLITAALIHVFFPGKIDRSGRTWIFSCVFSGGAILLTGFRPDLPSMFMMRSSADIEITLRGFRTELPGYLAYSVANALQWLSFLFSALSLRYLIESQFSKRWLTAWVMAAILMMLVFEWMRHQQLDNASLILKYALFTSTLIYLIKLTTKVRRTLPPVRYIISLSRCWKILAGLSIFHAAATLLNNRLQITDPVTLDWLCFTLMLISGILAHFTYLGIRLSQAELHRIGLAVSNQQLTQTVQERSELLQSIVDTLAAEQLESFAARIAHNINQPLTAIRMVLETLERIQPASEHQHQLRFVLGDVDRVAKVVSDTREMMRQTQYDIQVLDANLLLSEVVQILNNLSESQDRLFMNVMFIEDYFPRWVHVNKTALFQVLLTMLSPAFLQTNHFTPTTQYPQQAALRPTILVRLFSAELPLDKIAVRIQLPLQMNSQALHFFNTCDVEFQPPLLNDKAWTYKLIWIWHSLRKLGANLKASNMHEPFKGTQIDLILNK